MLRLDTFGGLVLTDGGSVVHWTQRRRLAILVLLAIAGERGLSRDKLAAYLWPESPTERARHALEQLLYGLRRQLHPEVVLGTNPVVLNPAIIDSDLRLFREAISRDEFEIAVRLYRGPFLEGFYLVETPEFERFVDAERSRLAAQLTSALEQLAMQARGRGDRAAAIAWWRRLVEIDPYATSPTLELMRELAGSGNRAAALECARVHKSLLRAEMSTTPDQEIAELVERILAAGEPGSTDSMRSSASTTPNIPVALQGVLETQAAPEPTTSSRFSSDAGSVFDDTTNGSAHALAVPRRSLAHWTITATIALLLLSAGITAWHSGLLARSRSHLDPALIAIAPFQVAGGDAGLGSLGQGIIDLLAVRMTGEAGRQAVDSTTTLAAWRGLTRGTADQRETLPLRLAREIGAGEVLDGTIVRTAGVTLTISARIRSTADGRVRARASVTGRADSIPILMDRFAASLLALDAGESEDRLTALTGTSLAAVRAYLAGRLAYRSARYEAAVADYARALELDSSFALAAVELASAAGYRMSLLPFEPAVRTDNWEVEEDSMWRHAVEIGRGHEQALSVRDRAYLALLAGARFPLSTPALEQLMAWERATEVNAHDADLWYHFGALLLYQGGAADVPDVRERAAEAFRRARVLDSEFVAPIAGEIELAAYSHNTAELARLRRAYFARDSAGETADYVRWRIASALDDRRALQSLRSRFDALSTQSLTRIQWTSQMDGVALEDADHAVAVLVHRAANPIERERACAQGFQLALNRGHPAAAESTFNTVLRLDRRPNCENPFLRFPYALYWDDDPAVAARTAADFEHRLLAGEHLPSDYGLQDLNALMMLGQWHLWQGDTMAVLRAITRMGRAAAKDSSQAAWLRSRTQVLAAMLATVNGSPDARKRVGELDSLARLGCCEVSHWTNPVLVRLWERLGDRSAALRAARRARWYFAPEYLSAALRDEARLAALTGDRESAIRAYRHFLALQSNPEPERRAVVEQARTALERLELERP